MVSYLPNLECLKGTCVFPRRNAVTLDWRTEKGGGMWRGSSTLTLGAGEFMDQLTTRVKEQKFAREGGGASRFYCCAWDCSIFG